MPNNPYELRGEFYNDKDVVTNIENLAPSLDALHSGTSCSVGLTFILANQAEYSYKQAEGYFFGLAAMLNGAALPTSEVSVVSVRPLVQTTTGYSLVNHFDSSIAGWPQTISGDSLLTGYTAFNTTAATSPYFGMVLRDSEPNFIYFWDGGKFKEAASQAHRWTTVEIAIRGKRFYPTFYYTET